MTRYVSTGTKSTVPTLNAELEKIATSQTSLLSRIGETPNHMLANLDMNSNRILNLPEPRLPTEPVRLMDVGSIGEGTTTVPEILSETVTLSSGQTTVNLSTVLPQGMALYISGVGTDNGRLHEGIQYIISGSTSVELDRSYPDGSILTAYNYTLASASDLIAQLTGASLELELIAHRGFRDSFPQNTMVAFTSAIKRGANSLECDVQITSDGIPVVFHDSTLDALTNGTGAVSTYTLAALQALTFTETTGSILEDIRIPTFAEVLRYCKGGNIKLYPEIKKYRTSADIELMINDVIAASMEDLAFFSSFVDSDITVFRAFNSTITCGIIGSSQVASVYEQQISAAAALGNAIAVWEYNALLATPALISYAQERGVPVIAYTVDLNTSAKDLLRAGVNKIVSDRILKVK